MMLDNHENASLETADVETTQFRPEWHFSPKRNWMNDPNGLVFFDGEYHLFFQFNPFGKEWGHMSWGHAISTDLIHWTELPVAIPESDHMVFSGCAVVDWENCSGLGDGIAPPLIALYTAYYEDRLIQSQHLAFSHDRGRTWQAFANNPVIDLGMEHFRDPKVFRHEASAAWIMVVALPREHKVQFYRSANLLDWSLASEFGPAGATGGQWECPDLIEVPIEGSASTRWVLKVDIDKDFLSGGSGAQYFVGCFDGFGFVVDPNEAPVDGDVLDFGPDFYAAVTWSDLPPDQTGPLLLGWLSNHQSGHSYPTHPWRGIQSIPRILSLYWDHGKLRVKQTPVGQSLREAQSLGRFQRVTADSPTSLEIPDNQACVAIDFSEVDWRPSRVRLMDGENEVAALSIQDGSLGFSRSDNDAFEIQGFAVHSTVERLSPVRNLMILVDKSTFELFVDDGELVFSSCLFPSGELAIDWQ